MPSDKPAKSFEERLNRQVQASELAATFSHTRSTDASCMSSDGGSVAVQWQQSVEPFMSAHTAGSDRHIHILHLSDLHIETVDQAHIYRTQLETDLIQEMGVSRLSYLKEKPNGTWLADARWGDRRAPVPWYRIKISS